jgi:hypothetical protein
MSIYRKILTGRTMFTAGLVALAATPLLTVPAHAATAQPLTAVTAQPLNVAAIGDSYASGEGDKGSGWIDAGCQRSAGAAPERAAGQLNAANRPVSFTSFACAGSMIENPSNPAQSLLGPDGQLSQVDPTWSKPVDALTISIGGNDIGFANIVFDCMAPFNTCSTDPNVTQPLAYYLNQLGGYPWNHGLLYNLIQAINNNRPDIENVFLTGYPDPTTGPGGALCGSSQAPAFGLLNFISPDDAAWASGSVILPLNTALQSAVSMANSAPGSHAVWHYVSGISNAFYSHGYCNPGARYVNTLQDSLASQGDQNGTMHPNDAGQQAIANVLYSDYVSVPLMSASVSAPSTPNPGFPSSFTVQALTFANKPIANASVLVDGNLVGHTDSSGALNVSGYVFPTAGNHTIVTQAAGYPDARAVLAVQVRPYAATSTPSPIPVSSSSIPALTLTASDNATNQLVNGIFTLTSGSGTLTLRSGATASNVAVTMGYKIVTVIIHGVPHQVRIPVCPTLTFQPDSTTYAPQNFSSLISCA